MRLEEELVAQARALEKRVPSYAGLLSSVADLEGTEAWQRIESNWVGRPFHARYERSLLLLASIRFDALSEGDSHPLWSAVSDAPTSRDVSRAAVLEALEPGRERVWQSLRSRYVQTNETSRGVAWLWPAASIDGPIALVDLGASAGLNLIADSLERVWVDGEGHPIPTLQESGRIVRRLGLDRRPIRPLHDEQALWLRSCIWAGETERIARFGDAVRSFRSLLGTASGPTLEEMSATLMPERLAALRAELGQEPFILCYQSIVRDYFEPSERESYFAGMREWLRSEEGGRALWMELEIAPDGTQELPVTLVAHARDGEGAVRSSFLGRCGFHPRTVYVQPEGVADLLPWISGGNRVGGRL